MGFRSLLLGALAAAVLLISGTAARADDSGYDHSFTCPGISDYWFCDQTWEGTLTNVTTSPEYWGTKWYDANPKICCKLETPGDCSTKVDVDTKKVSSGSTTSTLHQKLEGSIDSSLKAGDAGAVAVKLGGESGSEVTVAGQTSIEVHLTTSMGCTGTSGQCHKDIVVIGPKYKTTSFTQHVTTSCWYVTCFWCWCSNQSQVCPVSHSPHPYSSWDDTGSVTYLTSALSQNTQCGLALSPSEVDACPCKCK